MLEVAVKRIRLSFLSARFWIGCGALVVLTLSASLVSLAEFRQRRDLFEAQVVSDNERATARELVVYSQTHVFLHRRPEPLSILSRGLGERHGSVVELRGRYGSPRLTSRARTNFLLPGLHGVDTSALAGLVLSLMAVLLAAEVIGGEREGGTLQLAVSGGFPRWKWLTGEYLGLLATLLLPLAMASVLAGLVMVIGGGAGSWQLALRLLLWVATYALMTSAFLLLGLLISVVAGQPASALAAGFLAWAVLAVLYPAVTSWSVEWLRSVDPVELVRAENAITAETGIAAATGGQEELQLETFTNRNFAQANLISQLWFLDPYSNALLSAQHIAGTDLLAHRDFLRQARRVDEALSDWQAEKVSGDPQRESFVRASQAPLDLSGLPIPRPFSASLASAAGRLASPIGLLVAWNLALFLAAQATFFHYDLRLT